MAKKVHILSTNIKGENALELFRLTHAQKVQKMETIKGMEATAVKWALYSEVSEQADRDTGEVKEIYKTVFVFEDQKGTVYGTVSKTFIDGLTDFIVEFMDDGENGGTGPYSFIFQVESSTSKAGRTFLLFNPKEVLF